jgi:hypothetical protein
MEDSLPANVEQRGGQKHQDASSQGASPTQGLSQNEMTRPTTPRRPFTWALAARNPSFHPAPRDWVITRFSAAAATAVPCFFCSLWHTQPAWTVSSPCHSPACGGFLISLYHLSFSHCLCWLSTFGKGNGVTVRSRRFEFPSFLIVLHEVRYHLGQVLVCFWVLSFVCVCVWDLKISGYLTVCRCSTIQDWFWDGWFHGIPLFAGWMMDADPSWIGGTKSAHPTVCSLARLE